MKDRPSGAIPFGHIGNVPIRAHWSVGVIMVLVAAGLAGQVFPDGYPGRSAWEYMTVGVIAAVVFLLGLLAHEVSHAMVAQRNGVEVESITLWMFGGVAQLKGEAETPGAELRIAGVGPLVSLALGVVFTTGAVGAAAAGVSSIWVGALSWLGGINVLLAVFNLLPGAPLDGGRLLLALLWRWRGDRQWAAVTAARSGRALGWLIIAVSFVGFVFGYGLSAVWLALIGWFIVGAAGAEQRGARVASALAGLRVADVMTPSPDTAPPDISVALFIERYLFTKRHSAFPLTIGRRPLGLITLSRVRMVPSEKRHWTTLSEIAYPPSAVPVASPDEPVADVLARLNGSEAGRALVVEDGALVGILSPVDISRALERSELRSTFGRGPVEMPTR